VPYSSQDESSLAAVATTGNRQGRQQRGGGWQVENTWEWEKHAVAVPASAERLGASRIEFKFSQHTAPAGAKTRPLALLFNYISIA
jgi:hypothetical protein